MDQLFFSFGNTAIGKMRATTKARIINILENSPDGSCWIWKRCLTVRIDGKSSPIAHVALMLLGREVPKGYQIHHVCENKRCVNPLHLRVVTPSEHQKVSSHQRKRVETIKRMKTLRRNYMKG